MSERYLNNNAADREMGAAWEGKFCELAAWYGKAFHTYQIGREKAARYQKGSRPGLLPDVVMFSDGGEHHEVKHKSPTDSRRLGPRLYGWEKYRLDAITAFQREAQQPVLYTIHDWEAALREANLPKIHGSAAAMPNRLQDWRFANVQVLADDARQRDPHLIGTWLDGKARTVPGYYWPTSYWQSLDLLWGLPR